MSKNAMEVLLGSILPNKLARMEKVRQNNITAQNFSNEAFSQLWDYLDIYYDDHIAVMPLWALKEQMSLDGYDEADLVAASEMYKYFSEMEIAEHELDTAIRTMKERELTHRTGEVLAQASEILYDGDYISSENKNLRGQKDAREYILTELQDLEVVGEKSAPEGEMDDDLEEILLEYLDKENSPEEFGGIKYGISDLDEATGGIRPGELVLFAGHTGSGKSHLSVGLAYEALLSGHNVAMFTTETTRREMEIRLLARYSRDEKFKIPGGLDSHEILSGKLSEQGKRDFGRVLQAFREEDKGNMFVIQMPETGSMDYVITKANQYNRKAKLDLIIIDSINLLRAGRRYDTKREMLEDMLQRFKVFASSFDDGRGVAVASPWQMRRESWKEAVEAGGVYTLASLADTAEAERCLPLDGKVLTPEGFKEMREIQVGSKVINAVTGRPTKVKEVNSPGVLPILHVGISDGTTIRCSPGHVWGWYDEGVFRESTTMELLDLLKEGKEIVLPEMGGSPNLSKQSLNESFVHPYMLGRFMVEYREGGSASVHIRTKHPQLVFNMSSSHFPDFAIQSGDEVSLTYKAPYPEDTDAWWDVIVSAGLLNTDRSTIHVPSLYLYSKPIFREALLRGLLDCPYDSVSRTIPDSLPPELAPLAEWLQHSLGIHPTPRTIDFVEDLGEAEEVRCFTIAAPEGLFVTENFVVTHNSASQIVTLFTQEGEDTINIQLLKHRGGKEMSRKTYKKDWRNSFIHSSSSVGSNDRGIQRGSGGNLGSLMGGM